MNRPGEPPLSQTLTDSRLAAPGQELPAPPAVVERRTRPDGRPRVLIVRLSAVGDCVQTLPLACALRDHFPQAEISWVVERPAAALVALCPAVDRLVVLPRGFALRPRVLWWLRGVLRRLRPEITVDPQGLTKSGVVAWLSRARRRIGLARPAAREINPWLQTERVVSAERHRVRRYLELLRPLGAMEPRVRFDLAIPTAAQQAMDEALAACGVTGLYAVLNPGAGWDAKRWPEERYAQVARHLAAAGLRSVVVWAGHRERTWAEMIVAEAGGAAILAPPTTLVELAAVLKRAHLFVGSDTGPLHLAAAVGTPCVALFGASSGLDCGPLGPSHMVLQRAHDRSPGRKRPGADNWAMRQISVAEVCAACDGLLQARRPCAA